VLVLTGPIAAGDAASMCERLRAVADAGCATVIVCDVRALRADARSVDALARLQLTARRLGCRIRLHRASAELDELLSFLGLADVVGGAGGPDSR
jgi:ABC-type transporter Mla MlaB component